MKNITIIWLLQEVSFHNGTIITNLYADQMEGLRAASKAICLHMESLGMHHNLNKHYSNYDIIKQLVKTDSHESLMMALSEYDIFVTYLPVEERTFIHFLMKSVFDFSSHEPIALVTTKPLVQVKVDKACKKCKRNVSEDEDFCWHCGIKDPGK